SEEHSGRRTYGVSFWTRRKTAAGSGQRGRLRMKEESPCFGGGSVNAPVGRGSGALPPVGNADTYAFAPGRNAAPQAALAARWLRERTDAYLRVRLRDGEPTGAVHV